METPSYPQASEQFAPEPERPQYLKILCILSFVGCGLMLLAYGFGTLLLGINEEMIATVWQKMIETNPQLEDVDPIEFFHQVGMVCVYGIIATIFSLVGVIMMWRLEQLGFFIYALAELATNFFGVDMGAAQTKSWGGTVFSVLLDLIFIFMYFQNLKYMNKKNNNTFIQSGS